MNEFSVISWAPVGSALFTVQLEQPTGGVLFTLADVVGPTLPAADLLLDNGTPRPGVTQGSTYKIRVRTQGAFGLSTGVVSDPVVLGAPPSPASITIS